MQLAHQVSPQTWTQIEAEIKRQNVALVAQNKGKTKDAKAPMLAGLFTESDPIRNHPLGTVAANVVGVVGKEGKGQAGLEYGLNDKLSGSDGKAMYEVDAKGNKIPNADHTVEEPKPGVSVQLTLDSDLQWVAERRIEAAVKQWKAESGTVITQDVKSGEILAMANYPTYDPNKPVKPSALKNPALEQAYEPGSVQKVVTMAALADADKISLETRLRVPGSIEVDRRIIKDHFSHGMLNLTMAGVIAKSSNVGTILAARQMPIPQFVKYLKDFGFGEPTGLGFPGETRGLMPPGDEWTELTRSNVAFGQGLAVNAVQMTAAVNAVANGGVYMPPKLVKNYVDSNGNKLPNETAPPHRVVSEKAAKEVSTMMEAVTAEGGTALQAAIPGYRIAGKTGTAQEIDPACGCYGNKWATSFAGFAPADNPRFVTYVVLQNPTNGAGWWFPGRAGVPRRDEFRAAEVRRTADRREGAGRADQVVTPGQVGVTGPGTVASEPVSTPTAAGGAVAAIRPQRTVPVGLADLAQTAGAKAPTGLADVTGVSLDSRSIHRATCTPPCRVR